MVLIQTDPLRQQIRGQAPEPARQKLAEASASLPADVLIDDFDKTIQERFLTAPQFGIFRITPNRPISPHLDQFTPQTPGEISAVNAFAINGWDVGIYLFGRKVTRRTDSKSEKYDIKYRLFDPIKVTSVRKKVDFQKSTALIKEIKNAFVTFQKTGDPNENEVRFENGRWSYIVRPVRAANQSCLQCHKDYVITDRLGDGKFTVRERRIGDANGVLVYAFKKSNE